jgi:L-ornithine N5-monooxygenase
MSEPRLYDLIGIGFGPSNIALAIALEEMKFQGKALFLEKNQSSRWQGGMLLDGSDIQNNPLRDLITPVNPRSMYTFINYLHQTGRFWHFLNLGTHYPLRKDFFEYVAWVASQLPNVKYGVDVAGLHLQEDNGEVIWRVEDFEHNTYFARRLIVGTGRKLNIPNIPGLKKSDNIVHLTGYLPAVKRLPAGARVAVLGASQSAVEILLDLASRPLRSVVSIHRSFSYRLKDTSPFSDEVYFPDFTDYYHALPPAKRALLDNQVRQTNYSSADGDVIEKLYLRMYEDELNGERRIVIFRNHEIEKLDCNGEVVMDLKDIYTGSEEQVSADLLVLATGFLDIGRDGRKGLPGILNGLAEFFHWQEDYLTVERDYRVRYAAGHEYLPDLYLNGMCESSHGLGDAGSFSLVSIRARDICSSIFNRSVLREQRAGHAQMV